MLIAETGGINAMIVDSTALTEQVVRDVLASAFQSAGQRCSALRVLYVQEEARARVLEMLAGAMDALAIGDPWDPATDVGPVIDGEAEAGIDAYLAERKAEGQPPQGAARAGRAAGSSRRAWSTVPGIAAVAREVFGPVLHVAGFRAADLDRVVDAINARGYGLTCGLHSRIDDRVERVTARLHVGNAYVNRNQIGAIVGSQPFGGEGLSRHRAQGRRPLLPAAAPGARRAPTARRPRERCSRRRRSARPSRCSTPATGRRATTAAPCSPRASRMRAAAPPRRSRRPRCSTASRATCRGRPARATA